MNKPKILVLDIETSPVLAYVWGLFDQMISLGQIKKDWFVLSWAAKWYEGPDGTLYGPHKNVMYKDQRNAKDMEKDKPILKTIRDLMDEADIIITQNGIRFDNKKLNARFILNNIKKPSSFKHIDTLKIAKEQFAFTSNKLEYMTDKLCTKYKKLTTRKYAGFTLWKECLIGNMNAWNEMKTYNTYDILSLEELVHKLLPWSPKVNFNLYHDEVENVCQCGNKKFKKNGFFYTEIGKFQRYKCLNCGAETKSGKNLFSKEKKDSLKRGIK